LRLLSRGIARAAAITVASAIVGGSAYWYFASRLAPVPKRPLRIGFESNPPFQIRTASGYSGLAVEIVNNAARRAGLTLQWVETGASSEESFQKGLVDLWPLMTDLPERHKLVHFTAPYVIGSHVLLLRAGAPVPDRDFTGRIAVFKLPLHVRLARIHYPQAQPVPLPDSGDVLREVCRNGDVGLLEKRVAIIALKESRPECEIRLLNLDLNFKNGLASTFEAAGAAELLRREIGRLYREGALAQTVAKYSYYGLDDAWATYDLLQDAERGRWWAWGTGVFAVILVLFLWQTVNAEQRRRSERIVRESEERFRAIFQQAGVGVAQLSLDHKIEIANDRYCEVVGYPRKDLVGMETTDISHREDLREEASMLPRLLAGEVQSFSTEKRYTRQDGSVVWAAMYRTLVRDREGRPRNYIAVVEDITARKQAEAVIRESEERFRNLADSAPVMIWTCGPDRRCTFYNKRWQEFVGKTLEQVLATNWADEVHPEDRDRCIEIYLASFDARADYQFECRLRRFDGEYRWFLNRGVARSLSSGAFAGFVGCSIEITDLKRHYDQHLAMQKMESVGILASGVAHDFNNVLGSIAALAESAQSDLPRDSPAAADVARIHQTALGASHIASQLMTFARQDSAPAVPLDLSALIAEMLDLLKVSISKSAALQTSLARDLPPVSANPSEIRQLVLNLVLNASEALDGRPGAITVTTSALSGNDAPGARLEVADTGTGMSGETRARAFDPFFSTRAVGRGLGLSAVQGIVRRLNGSIDVESAPGAGSRFVVLLPSPSQLPLPCPEPAPPSASAANRPITVLFVDDEESLRVSVARLLRKKSFRVIEAADGPAAIDSFKNSDPQCVDVILLDVTLPGMRGSEVLDELRRIRDDVRVVICTAYSQETALTEFAGRQVDGFIRKPYRSDDLVKVLRQVGGRESRW
jgi:two-component system cell cycle sensor histidine kinase/response regulator CckA